MRTFFWLRFTIIFILCFSVLGGQIQALEIGGEAYFLMDPYSGRIFLEKNASEILPVASISKLMTLVLILESVERAEINLEDLVTASPFAASKRGSRIWLEAGEQLSLKELIYAIAVGSANDAAVAVAEFIAGSEANFVTLMNIRGTELGLQESYFANSTGLPEEEGSSMMSARDVARLVQHAMKITGFMDYVSTYEFTMRASTTKIPVLWNANKLLRRYYGVDGVKTGFTTEAGYCIAATAEREHFRLVAITLGHKTEEERESAARALLDYGFRKYESLKLYAKEEIVGKLESPSGTPRIVDVVLPEDFYVTVERGQELDLTTRLNLNTNFKLPIDENQVVGSLTVLYNEEIVGSTPLTVNQTVKKLNFINLVVRLVWEIAQAIF